MKKSIILILALLIKSQLSNGQIPFELTIDCDSTIDDGKGFKSVLCFVRNNSPFTYNYSDSIKNLAPEVTVQFSIDSLCDKKIVTTKIKNKYKYNRSQIIYITRYFENIVKNATIVYRTKTKMLDCKEVSSLYLSPFSFNFDWK